MLKKLITRLRALFRKAEMERELDEELRLHIERQTAQNVRLGMDSKEARIAARRAFGGVEQAKERSRDARGMRWIEEIWQDLRYGARMLIKKPGFTLVAVLTLMLGIGANTAIFSVINTVLLKPLPYTEPERLVAVWEVRKDGARGSVSYLNFVDWRAQNGVFERIAIYREYTLALTGGSEPANLHAVLTTPDLFPLLKARPLLGRVFLPDEEKA